jgi:CheY-like chemotaxis protein
MFSVKHVSRILVRMNIPGPIVVLDDDPDDHEIIRMICNNLQVCTPILFFHNPSQLLDFLRSPEKDPFIILCDINMPILNGLEVREIIWKDDELRKKSIPFLFFSTSSSRQQVEKAFDLTVQGFFLKGQTLEETEKKVKLIFDYWLESKSPNHF